MELSAFLWKSRCPINKEFKSRYHSFTEQLIQIDYSIKKVENHLLVEDRPPEIYKGLRSSLGRLHSAKKSLEALKAARSPLRPECVTRLLHWEEISGADLNMVAEYISALESVLDALNVRFAGPSERASAETVESF